jgi:AraC family transcriptional regulator
MAAGSRIEGATMNLRVDGIAPPVPLPRYHEQLLAGERGCGLRERRVAGEIELLRLSRVEGPVFLSPVADYVLAEAQSRFTMAYDGADGGARHAVSPGDLLLTPPGSPTRLLIDRPSLWRVVAIPPEHLSNLNLASGADSLSVLHRVPFRSAWICTLIDRLWEEARPGNPSARAYSEGALILLLTELKHHAAQPAPMATGGLAPWQVRRATDHMQARIGERVSLDELAELVGLSVFHFCRTFKVSTGLTPQRWLQNERMTVARRLLSMTEKSVNEIAASVGYESHSHFSRMFRRAVGASPRHFRNTHHRFGE